MTSSERFELPDYDLQLRVLRLNDYTNAIPMDINETRPAGYHFESRYFWGSQGEYMTRVYSNKEHAKLTEVYRRRAR